MLLPLLFKIALVLLLFFIIFNLMRALLHISKTPLESSSQKKPVSHFLGRRVFFSALVVVLLLIAFLSGWIEPNPRPY
ncbi:DUF2909 domain-containing protein [Vibrio clamense]|uniref:DUF2909 domain-containing protein n=1 Tax=Vibrio clamense TaxID=2910254 RepID=UPI003D22843D